MNIINLLPRNVIIKKIEKETISFMDKMEVEHFLIKEHEDIKEFALTYMTKRNGIKTITFNNIVKSISESKNIKRFSFGFDSNRKLGLMIEYKEEDSIFMSLDQALSKLAMVLNE